MSLRLGKAPYKHDARTVMLSDHIIVPQDIPTEWDFDHNRRQSWTNNDPFAYHMYANDHYGCCVIAGRANQTLRFEKLDHGVVPPISDDDVIKTYQRLSGCQSPGDSHDTGLEVLDALKDWRNNGWDIPIDDKGTREVQKIAAFGRFNAKNLSQIKEAIYLLGGVGVGVQLPATAQTQVASGVWDVVNVNDPTGYPGSWGGHYIYCKRYDSTGIYCLTWGREVRMTDSFFLAYVDEVWGMVDDIEAKSHALDVASLQANLQAIGATNIE